MNRYTSISVHLPQSPSVGLARTYVVFGAPRGGTTMVAGALRLFGINLGSDLPVNCEDSDFNLHALAKQEISDPVAHMLNTIQRRNLSSTSSWGWKYPQAEVYLRKLLPALRNPALICVMRDPVSIAMRNIFRRKQPAIPQVLHWLDHQKKNLQLIQESELPTLLVSYEKAAHSPIIFSNELAEFLNMSEQNERIAEVTRFIQPEAGYQNLELSQS
jgi:hypothetical protein